MGRKILGMGLAMVLVMGLGFSCKKKEPKLEEKAIEKEHSVSGCAGEPAWVTRCAGAFPDAGKDAFYGCGNVSNISNRALEMQTADARAKTDLAKTLDTYVASLFKDFMNAAAISQATAKAGMTDVEEKQFVESITKQVTETTLYGVQTIDRWRCDKTNTLYAVCRVSFENMAQAMKKQMAERAKELKIEANKALEELDKELEKRRASGQ